MELTNKQNNDLITIKFFIPSCYKDIIITNNDIKMFFEYSEQGMHKIRVISSGREIDGFSALIEGKRWRGINIHEMWEDSILDGSVPYWTLLGGESKEEILPRKVVNFMKKEMFKGEDKEIIEELYNKILIKWK